MNNESSVPAAAWLGQRSAVISDEGMTGGWEDGEDDDGERGKGRGQLTRGRREQQGKSDGKDFLSLPLSLPLSLILSPIAFFHRFSLRESL